MEAMQLIPEGRPFCDAAEHLKGLARETTGLVDFGAPDYEPGLRAFLDSLDRDAGLTGDGRQVAAGLTMTALCSRLVSEASLRAHPEHAQVRLEAPIVILGLPRTGTTALHELLCCDPAHQGLELWLGQSPMPRPPRAEWDQHPAYRRSVAAVAETNARFPGMADIHSMQPGAPDECWNLLRQTFTTVTFECLNRVPGYSQWWAACDMGAAYERYAANLRLIGLNDRSRRWVLKDPSHLFAPRALFATFPDAVFVMTHRDPARSIPSVCSLNESARRGTEVAPDPAALGREQLELWARGIERAEWLRQQASHRITDVHLHELLADPLAVVRRIYAAAGSRLGAEPESRMRTWLERNRPAPHRYGPERWGLTNDAVRARFASYIDRCGVAIEAEPHATAS